MSSHRHTIMTSATTETTTCIPSTPQKDEDGSSTPADDTSSTAGGGCASPGCTNIVKSRLACPKCIQLGISPPAYFCGQQCFKKNYGQHKQVHVLAKQILAAKQQQMQEQQR